MPPSGGAPRAAPSGKVKGGEIALTRDVGGFAKEEIVARRVKE